MRMIIDFFPELLRINLIASIVILAVLVARLFLKPSPKVFSYALWGIVLLRLLIPVSIPSPVSVIPATTAVSSEVINDALPHFDFETPSDMIRNKELRQHQLETGNPYGVQVSHSLVPGEYLAIGWLLGVACMVLYSGLSYRKIRKQTEVAVPLRDNIWIADDIQSPFVIGFTKPKIYLPCNLGEKEQEYIILHEQHHIRRFDHIVKALFFLALTIHWFNPLVWVAFILACKDMEMSCDEAVIGKLGEDVRADYAASLLNLATGHRIIAGTPLAFGEGDTKGRIRNLARWKKPVVWVLILAVILCLVLCVCLLTDRVTRHNQHVGTTFYYGSVTDQKENGENSQLSVLCNDGNKRIFSYEAGTGDIPADLVGKQVWLRARKHSLTGALITTQAETVPDERYETLEEAIQRAILYHHRDGREAVTLACASFYTLASEGSGPAGSNKIETVTEYGIVYHQNYKLVDGKLEEDGGCNVPTVLTFRIDDDGLYSLAEYWEPRDGNYYPEDIKAKFPVFIWPDTQEHLFEQKIAIFQQVMDGFQVGPETIVEHLIDDISIRERWAGSFGDLMLMCKLQRELLAYYGQTTLDYCAGQFASGPQDDTRGKVMAYVCNEILDSMGLESVAGWTARQSGQEWYDAFIMMYPRNNWGITLKAENATPNGAKITMSQTGGYLPGRLFYGSDFGIQRYEDGIWADLEPGEGVAWTMVAYSVPLNDSISWNIDWSDIYGTLEPGQYRFCKSIMDHRATGDNEYAVFFAEFEIP